MIVSATDIAPSWVYDTTIIHTKKCKALHLYVRKNVFPDKIKHADA